MSASLKSRAPWWVKIPAKIVLSRLPIPYSVWRRLNMFKHGFMTDPLYAERVFLEHFGQLDPAGRRDFTCLELGPGDSLLSAIIAHKHGASRVYLVDVGPFAVGDADMYRAAADALLPASSGNGTRRAWNSVDDMLAWCNAAYLTEGVASLASIPSASVDFIWSQAVLEHVRQHDFQPLLAEMRRILRPGGVASHRVDLRDHLGGSLNNLRFRDEVWEGDIFSKSGFYTNRLRYSEIIAMCEAAGLVVSSTRPDHWPAVPTPRSVMDERFRRFSDDDLRVHGFFLTLATT